MRWGEERNTGRGREKGGRRVWEAEGEEKTLGPIHEDGCRYSDFFNSEPSASERVI